MAIFAGSVTFKTSSDVVWQQLRSIVAGDAAIVLEKPGSLLVAMQGGTTHVFWLEEQNILVTLHFTASLQPDLATRLAQSADVASVLDSLPSESAEPERIAAEDRFSLIIRSVNLAAHRDREQTRRQPAPAAPARAPIFAPPGVPSAAAQAAVPAAPPFNPTLIVMTGLLISSLGAGMVAAINWRRLGKPGFFWPTLIGSGVALVVFYFALPLLPLKADFLLLAGPFINVLFGVALAALQRPAYEAWRTAHGGMHPAFTQSGCSTLIGIGMGAFILGALATFSIFPALLPVAMNVLPARTFSAGGVSMKVPGAWVELDFSPETCAQIGAECLFAAAPFETFPSIAFNVMRVRTISLIPLSADQMEAQVWALYQIQTPSAVSEMRETFKIAGRDAVRRTLRQASDDGHDSMMWIFIQDGWSSVIRIAVQGTSGGFDTYRGRIDAIVNSIRIAAPQ